MFYLQIIKRCDILALQPKTNWYEQEEAHEYCRVNRKFRGIEQRFTRACERA